MSIFYLVRHGSNDFLGRAIAGRIPGVSLNEKGRQEAERTADVLSRKNLHRIYSSPLERAQETAKPLAARLKLPIEIAPEFNEVDFGDWNGGSLKQLDQVEQWKRFNSFRSGTRIPNGELVIETQARFVAKMEALRKQFPNDTMAIFAHADPIRCAVAYYMGVPLDLFLRIEISPASYSVIAINDGGPQIRCINVTPE